MEQLLWFLVLSSGVLLAGLLFALGWRHRRRVRFTVAVISGVLLAAQTAVWHLLYLWGGASRGDDSAAWRLWVVPVLVHVVASTAMLRRKDPPPSPLPPPPASAS